MDRPGEIPGRDGSHETGGLLQTATGYRRVAIIRRVEGETFHYAVTDKEELRSDENCA